MRQIWKLEKSIRVVLTLAAAVVLAPTLAAVDDLCGTTVVSNLKLNHDLTCTEDGLIVGAHGITINLNGHTIAGSGSGVGISVIGRTNVSIKGGIVQNFATGVQVLNSTAVVIRENQFVDNTDGIDLQAGSVGNTIKENHFQNNSARGIMHQRRPRARTLSRRTRSPGIGLAFCCSDRSAPP